VNNVLVLGSDGQIGSGLVRNLELSGYSVIGYDIFSNISQDLRVSNTHLVSEITKADFVFFLAFDVGGSKYLNTYQNSFEFIQNNVEIMANTFKLLKKNNSRFIFASSQMAEMIYSNYGLLKLLGEKYTNSIDNGKFVRFWNVYGIEKVEEKFHVITDFISMAREKKLIEMRTDGEESRDFLHIDDCSSALIYIMENFDAINKDLPLHIASFKYTRIFDVAKIIAERFDAKIVKGTKQDNVQLDAMMNPDPVILELWQPKIDLEQGIDSIINSMDFHDYQ
jgi:nucleoside-diphosphate-sugar epimerase